MTEESFWNRVDVQGEDDCWPWTQCLLRAIHNPRRKKVAA